MARLRVAATSADNQAVGAYRIWEPLRALLKRDLVEMIALPTLNIHCKETAAGNRVVGVDAPDADVLILQRPTNWAIADSIPFFQRAGLAVVIDLDDDIRHIADKHSQRTIYDPRYNPHENWRHLLRACSHADLVVVSTPALSVYAPHGRYEVVRNCVPERYLDVERKTDGRTVGWGGTVLNHPGDLPVTNGGVASAVRETGARFMVVGDGSDVRRHLHLDEEPIRTGLISISEYPLRVAEFTVGIAPLERSEFNDAKCIQLGMRIFTHSGMRKAGEIIPGDKVWSRNGWVSVEATERQPVKPGFRFTTEAGRVLEVSADHKLWASGEWRHARDIKVGAMFSVVSGGAPQHVVTQEANWPADSRVSRVDGRATDFCSATQGPRIRIGEVWATFLGLFVGDGSVGQGTSVVVSCDGQDADVIDFAMDHLASIGLRPHTEAVTTWGGQVLRRRSVSAASANLIRFLYGLGLAEWDGGNVSLARQRKVFRIPDVIWRSPASVQAAFLAGLFEADGGIDGTQVSFTSKSNQLARDVQLMLVSFGIESTLREQWLRSRKDDPKRHQSFRLTTRRAGTDTFSERIGFLSARKRAKLAAVVAKRHSNAYRVPTWEDRVAAVEECQIETVDLQVEGHEFAVEGLRSHNSFLKLLEYAALSVPFVASANTPEYLYASTFLKGFFVKDRGRSWRRAVLDYLEDPGLRAEHAAHNREEVRANWTMESQCENWLRAWEHAVENREAAK